MSNSSFHDALLAYDTIVNNSEKLRESVRYFFAKYPNEAIASITPILRNENGGRVFTCEGTIISEHNMNILRNMWAHKEHIPAIKFLRNLASPVITLKGAKDFCEEHLGRINS